MRRAVLALYRAGLLLLPPTFRRAYGAAMLAQARVDLADATLPRGAVRLATDLLASLGREWTEAARGLLDGGPSGLGQDVRFATRTLRRQPVFTATVVVTLGLGIGANTAIFSVVDGVLLRALPYPEADRLVAVWPSKLFNRDLMDRAGRELRTLTAVGGTSGRVFTVTEGGAPAEVFGLAVTPDFFDVLRVQPALGRGFRADDGAPGAEPVVILSHRLWVERYGGSAAVLGTTVDVQSEGVARRTVVGVMPADHRAIRAGAELWTPVVTDPASDDYTNRSFLDAVGRLADGVDRAAADAEVAAWTQALRDEDPGMVAESDAARGGVLALSDELAGPLRFHLVALAAAVALVLLIACANVANLLLARTRTRRLELGVRTALGAGRGRLLRQLMTESLLLAAAGGLAGLGLALATRGALLGLLPGVRAEDVTLDGRVLVFSLAISAAAGLLFGAGPSLRAARAGAAGAGRVGRSGQRDRGAAHLQQVLVGAEVAMALVTVFAAGLVVLSVRDLMRTDPGFDPGPVLTVRVTAPASLFPEDDDVLRYFDEVTTAIRAVPGVDAAGGVGRLPMAGGRSEITIYPEGFEPGPGGELPDATHRVVTAGYAEAMGFRLREGRLLAEADLQADEPYPVVVNATLADRFWPDGALGRAFLGRGGVRWLTVVGVVEDVAEEGLNAPPRPAVYIPHQDWAWRTLFLAVRTRGDARAALPAVRAAVWSVAPDVPVAREASMEEVVHRSVADTRVTGTLFALFGALALLLGAVGVYGVMAFAVVQRTREFGVRLALGATRGDVARDAFRTSGLTALIGIAAGAAATPAVGGALSGSLEGVRDSAPGLLAVVALVLLGVALTATWLPARRAARVDPVTSLRAE
ncbi:MAG: ADOP family duplicated permease [Longimicrobiales bacterium]